MLIVRLVSLALITLFTGGMTAWAQEATSERGFDPAARFPAHIHAGTCEEPGEIAWELAEGGFGLPAPFETETPSDVRATYVGPDAANPAIVSVTTLDATLDELVADGHVIDAHTAAEGVEAATRIACGAVGGFLAGDDLVFGMQEANGSRHGGTGWLHANGDDTTTVTLFLVSGLGNGANTALGNGATTPADEPEVVAEAEPAAPLPSGVETTELVVEGGEFTAEELTLVEDLPTVLRVTNDDDRPYHFRINDLVATIVLPPNELTVVEFTTPSGGVFAGRLLAPDDEAELDLLPVTVVPRPEVAP
ncbi:MAG: cupredoxin domain-containing protein [Chloroflexi bacterium]|nr:cupredoxin domain-containing protein [Chloroflexota bacterium]